MSSHGTTAGSGNSSLTAPLVLPAVAGSPLTTQGGTTLDDGSGEMTLDNAGNGTGQTITNGAYGTGHVVYNNSGGTGQYIANSSTGFGQHIANSSTGPGQHIDNFSTGPGQSITNGGGGPAIYVANTGAGNTWEVPASGITQCSGTSTSAITSGALPTIALVSGTAAQVDVSRDVDLTVPVTYSPTATAAATCQVAISADNVTYSVLSTETIPAASVAGVGLGAKVHVPAGWYVKLTVTNAALGTATYY